MKFQDSRLKILIIKLLLLVGGVMFLLPQSKAQSNDHEVIRNFMNTQGVRMNSFLVDDEGYFVVAGYINDYAYLAKADTATREVLWDTAYHADYCGLEAHNQYFDIKQHPEGGYLVTKLIHECGASNYEYKIIHVSKEGEFLKEGTTKNKGVYFPEGYGGNPLYRDLIIREDGHIITLMKTRYIGQNGNLEAIIEFDENLEFVKYDTSLKNHDVRLHSDGNYLYAYGQLKNREYGLRGPYVLVKFDLYTFEKLDEVYYDGFGDDMLHSNYNIVFAGNNAYLSHFGRDTSNPSKFFSNVIRLELNNLQKVDTIKIHTDGATTILSAHYNDFLIGTQYQDSSAVFVVWDKFFNKIKEINPIHPDISFHFGLSNFVQVEGSKLLYTYRGEHRKLHFFEIDLEELNLVSTPQRAVIDTEVRLFPNPSATGNFELVSEQRFSQINVFSMEGKLIKTYQHRGNRFEFNLNESGIYLIQTMLQNGDTQTFKAVKL